jgi:hypothetical protein
MKGLTYFAAFVVIVAALMFAQNSGQNPTTSSDSSNSSKSSAQSQNEIKNGTTLAPASHRKTGEPQNSQSQSQVPDATVRDQQRSTTSTTGATGQSNAPAFDLDNGNNRKDSRGN